MNKLLLGTHCSYCGSKFAEQVLWPRHCFVCDNTSYINPTPVVVAMVPVITDTASQCSWLVQQRNIEPMKDGWAFPSGYVDAGESWQQAVVRELQEEVGLITDPAHFKLFDVVTAKNGNMLLFCYHRGVNRSDIKFEPNHEVKAIDFPVLPQHIELCFPTHNEVWRRVYSFHIETAPPWL